MNEKITFTSYKDKEHEDTSCVCSIKSTDNSNKNEENETTITLDEFWKKYKMSEHVWELV